MAVARAFAAKPDLLLMDEPYGQLDVKLRCYLEDELVRTAGVEEHRYLRDSQHRKRQCT